MQTGKALSMGLVALLLTGCAAKRFDYQPATEIPEGPGMLSGKDGAFVLYSEGRQSSKSADNDAPEGHREFREFQEFKRWKEANRDTPEYREFREWLEWKAYRAWKKDGS